MRGFGQDLRVALRGLWRNPALTALTVLVLALGIGANTAVFSVVDALVVRPVPFPDPERLIAFPRGMMYQDFVDVRAQNRSLAGLAAYRPERSVLTGQGEAEFVTAVFASADLFAVLGVHPVLGRGFRAGEDRAGEPPVAVVSHGFWQQRLDADPGALGRTVTVDGKSLTVVGVMPAGFRFPLDDETADVWVALQVANPPRREWRAIYSYRTVARLSPGVTVSQAEADLGAVAARLARQHGSVNPGLSAVVAYDGAVKRGRGALLLLLGAVGFVLLIACANVANLQLVRATARRREMAIRAALGAGRGRIVRQLLTESVLLAVLGGGLGLLVAVWGVSGLGALIPQEVPRVHPFSFDARVLLFTTAAALVTAMLVGLAPALAASRVFLTESLRAGERGAAPGRGRVRAALLVAQIALAMVLLVGAGLLVRSFERVLAVDPGFDPRSLLTARVKLRAADAERFHRELLLRLESLPGARGATIAAPLPFARLFGAWTFTLDDRPPPEAPLTANVRGVSTGYFRTLRIPIVAGRDFQAGDERGPDHVAIVNESFARRHWPQGNPLGRRIRAYEVDRRIIGVAADTLGSCGATGCIGAGAGRLDGGAEPEIIFPNSAGRHFYIAVRAAGSPSALVGPLRAAVREVDPNVPLTEVRTMDEAIDESLGQRRSIMLLLGLFAALALVLAAVGIYGVVSYSVTLRTREIGVRMALGAQAFHVQRTVVGEGLRLCLVGLAVGVAAALALTRVMRTQLYGVSATDPATFAALAALLLGVAALAALLPARRATRVDPMIALRAD
jgi:putative ABC transport system permease protein